MMSLECMPFGSSLKIKNPVFALPQAKEIFGFCSCSSGIEQAITFHPLICLPILPSGRILPMFSKSSAISSHIHPPYLSTIKPRSSKPLPSLIYFHPLPRAKFKCEKGIHITTHFPQHPRSFSPSPTSNLF